MRLVPKDVMRLSGRHDLSVGVVAAKLRGRLWSTRRSVAVSRDLQAAEHVLPLEGILVELVAPDEFDELSLLVQQAGGVEYLYLRTIERARLARAGALSVARTVAGELVAFHFVYESSNHDVLESVAPHMYPVLPDDSVLTEGVYCLPAYRGQGLTSALLHATGALLLERGKRRVRAYVDTSNVAALRMFNRTGYLPTGEERVVRYRVGRLSTRFRDITSLTLAEWEAAVGESHAEHAGG